MCLQYKEAFLEANPDFKWYKLPAPPLRTLVTRPSNQKPPKQLDMQSSLAGPIVPGKLADESQLGGLSSLLLAGAASGAWPPVPKPPKKRYLEEAATPLAAWEGTSSHLSPSQPGPSVAAPEEAAPAASGTPETNNNEASYTNGKSQRFASYSVPLMWFCRTRRGGGEGRGGQGGVAWRDGAATRRPRPPQVGARVQGQALPGVHEHRPHHHRQARPPPHVQHPREVTTPSLSTLTLFF